MVNDEQVGCQCNVQEVEFDPGGVGDGRKEGEGVGVQTDKVVPDSNHNMASVGEGERGQLVAVAAAWDIGSEGGGVGDKRCGHLAR